MTSVAQQLLTLAHAAGVEYIFCNLGSDHPAFIEAFARMEKPDASGPKVVICPHEMTALSAAHGYSMMTRKPQMVLVHVDVGTENLGGSVHNIARGRVPVLIVAGLSPVTLNGELVGSRTEFIHFLQDTPHQDDIVRPYVKWAYEMRAAESADSVLLRALQISSTEPQGPVYLTGAREVWSALVQQKSPNAGSIQPAHLAGLTRQAAQQIASAAIASKRPLAITSYLGRNTCAVNELVKLSEQVGIGVIESLPQTVNFPGDHPHHLGYQIGAHVDEADFILLLDVDIPWLPIRTRPAETTRILQIDSDPLKSSFGHWYFPVEASYQADTMSALSDILAQAPAHPEDRDERLSWIRSKHRHREEPLSEATIDPDLLAAAVRELVTDRTVLLLESPTGTLLTLEQLRPSRPGSFFMSGGSALGWGINAAIGAKLAQPDSEVIALVGDGSFVFGVPSSAYWVARTYSTPFLTVIANNGGWHSPKHSTRLVYPQGTAEKTDRFGVTMTAGSKLAEIAAAAGNAAAFRVSEPATLRQTLQEAMASVRGGQNAVVEAIMPAISTQKLGAG